MRIRTILVVPVWLLLVLPFSASLGGQTYSISQLQIAGTARGTNIAVDAEGSVIYADGYASTIVRVSPAGVATTVAGATNQKGSTDGPGATARFNYPTGVAVDEAGNIYVVDVGNYTVRRISSAGVVTKLAGRTGVSGYIDGTSEVAQFRNPGAIALAPTGEVFVADYATDRSRIRKISPAGVVSTIVQSPASDSTGAVAPFGVNGMAVDSAGNLFFADAPGGTIRKVTPAGAVSIVAGAYNQPGTLDGVGGEATFFGPGPVSLDSSGNLLVIDADGSTLRRVTPSGVVSTIAGQPYPDFHSPFVVDGVGGAAVLRSTVAVSSDRSGNIYLLSVDQWLARDTIRSVLRKGTPTTSPSRPILTQSPARDDPRSGLNSRNVGARASVSFSAAAASDTPVSFQWMKNGQPIAGATQATFVISSASASDDGEYWIRLTNAGGQCSSSPVPLRVFSPAFDAFTSRRTVSGGSFLWGISSGAGRLVTVGTGGKILTSTDELTWTVRNAGTTEWLVGVTYGAGKFVAVGDRGVILVSSDGVTWSRAASSGTNQRLNNVAYGDNRFVAVGEGGAIVTSTDALTWTAQNSGVTTWLRGLVFVAPVPMRPLEYGGNGTGCFYASGQDGVILAGYSDGRWSASRVFFGNSTRPDIEALAGRFGIGQDGVVVGINTWTSANSSNKVPPYDFSTFTFYAWSRGMIGLTARFRGLAVGADAIFATGENGVVAAAQSFSGPWSFIPTGTTANLVCGVFHGNSLFVVGENETILQSQPLYQARLINIATRGGVSPGSPMIAGFVITGPAPKQVLVRAAGPALGRFGISATLGSPMLTLFDNTGRTIATNSGWSTSPDASAIAAGAERVGAFPFAAGSLDSAVFATLAPGAYTAQVTGGSGTALVEVYDADVSPTPGSRSVNIATRAQAGSAEQQLIAGFVINGAASRKVLIRAVGPSLAQFGLDGLLAEPQIELYDQRGRLLQRAGAWLVQPNADEIIASGMIAGAFPLADFSKDAALVTSLLPGGYTVQVYGADRASTGLALVEVYDLP